MDKKIADFHLPRWNELPNIDLYIDQLVSLLEQYFLGYVKNENENDEKLITKSMINNYVKHGVLNPPINKKYNREHIATSFVIIILKQIYSIDEIKKLINLAIQTSSFEQSYDRFCLELDEAIRVVFNKTTYTDTELSELSEEQYLLKNVVHSFANKLYVQITYLKKRD